MMAKLVRDKVPDIIRRDGREPAVRRVRGDELKGALKEKLVEEALELRGSDDVYEELADLLEVVDAIIARCGVDRDKLDDVKKKKLERAGGFEEGLVLIDE